MVLSRSDEDLAKDPSFHFTQAAGLRAERAREGLRKS